MKARKAPSPRLGNHPHRFLLGRRTLAGHSITALLVLASPLKKGRQMGASAGQMSAN